MKYFEKYNSNTYAGSGNQLYFEMNENEMHTGRIFYKISVGGEYSYSILFSNIIDSTYADGSTSHKNLICDTWSICGARIGRCKYLGVFDDNSEFVMDDENSDIVVSDFKNISFD